jgi:hypothetical protein
VLDGGPLRDRLVEAGSKRAEDFTLERTRARFCETITGVLEAHA